MKLMYHDMKLMYQDMKLMYHDMVHKFHVMVHKCCLYKKCIFYASAPFGVLSLQHQDNKQCKQNKKMRKKKAQCHLNLYLSTQKKRSVIHITLRSKLKQPIKEIDRLLIID